MKYTKKRIDIRFPCIRPVDYMVMGDLVHPPSSAEVQGETVDLSSFGMRIRVKGQKLQKGAMLRIRIPLSDVGITVPVLAQVKWIKKEVRGNYEAGIMFIE